MNAAVWFYIAVTVAGIIWFGWRYTLAVESRRWPRTKGKVVRAWAEQTDSENNRFSPRVEYTYKVDGKPHRSTTVWITGEKSMRKLRAEMMASSYHPGDAVEVWYDPEKPQRAALIPGGDKTLLVAIIAISTIGPILAIMFTDPGRKFFEAMGINFE